jgi:hypothetical protein
MAKITISELRPAGADLFEGSESFMHELNEQEITDVLGGGKIVIANSWLICVEW